GAAWPREFEILYVVDVQASKGAGALVVELLSRARKRNGEWSVRQDFKATPAQAGSLPDPVDRDVIVAMLGGQEYLAYYSYLDRAGVSRVVLSSALALRLIPSMAATGRLTMRASANSPELRPLAWDYGDPWRLWLEVRQQEGEQW